MVITRCKTTPKPTTPAARTATITTTPPASLGAPNAPPGLMILWLGRLPGAGDQAGPQGHADRPALGPPTCVRCGVSILPDASQRSCESCGMVMHDGCYVAGGGYCPDCLSAGVPVVRLGQGDYERRFVPRVTKDRLDGERRLIGWWLLVLGVICVWAAVLIYAAAQ